MAKKTRKSSKPNLWVNAINTPFVLAKQLLTIKNSTILMLLNTVLLISLVFLSIQFISILPISEDIKKTVRDWSLPLSTLVGTLLSTIVIRFFGNRHNTTWEKMVEIWGRGLIVLALTLLNVSFIVGNKYIDQIVHNPCYGITKPEVTDGQSLVLFAKFSEDHADSEPSVSWPIKLRNEIDSKLSSQFVFFQLPSSVSVVVENDAKTQNRCYKATMTIWGAIGSDYIEVNYTINQLLPTYFVPTHSYLRGVNDKSGINYSKGILPIDTFRLSISKAADTEYALSVLSGILASQVDQKEKAVSYFTQAINSVSPENASRLKIEIVYCLRSTAYRESKNIGKAIADANTAISLNPTNSQVYTNRGDIYVDTGQFALAISDYKKALEYNKSDIRAYLGLSVVAFDQSDYAQSLDYAKQAVKSDSNNIIGYFDLAMAELSAGHIQASYESVETVRKMDPDFYYIYLVLSSIQFNDHKYYDAVNSATYVINIDPKLADAYFTRAAAYVNLKDYEKAINDYTEAYNLGLDDPMLLAFTGFCLHSLGRNEEAIDKLEQYIKLSPVPDPSVVQVYNSIKEDLKKK